MGTPLPVPHPSLLRRRAGSRSRNQPIAAARRRQLSQKIGKSVQVLVRDNNIDQALRVLKKKLQREGVFREMKQHRAYEKPSEKRARQMSDAIRRSRKLARKQAQRDGLLPMPKPKERPARPRPAVIATPTAD
jgi:SSU ribosomal protein S21P